MTLRDGHYALTTGAPNPEESGANTRRNGKGGSVDSSVLGMAAHEVIAALAQEGLRAAEFERITRAVRGHPATQAAAVHRQAARQWLMSTTMLYFRLFAPPDSWSLLGAEIDGPICRFDLVWKETSTGTVVIDELKTGKAGDLVGGGQLDAQLERQRCDGIELYGDLFLGIRLLILAAPRRSLLVSPDAHRSPLYPKPAS